MTEFLPLPYHTFRKPKRLKSGKKVYRWYYYWLDQDGKQHQKACIGCRNRSEAESYIRDLAPPPSPEPAPAAAKAPVPAPAKRATIGDICMEGRPDHPIRQESAEIVFYHALQNAGFIPRPEKKEPNKRGEGRKKEDRKKLRSADGRKLVPPFAPLYFCIQDAAGTFGC